MIADVNTTKSIDVLKLYTEVLGKDVKNYTIPPQSFEIMQAEILEYDEDKKFMLVKMPILDLWLNPYGTMQGGMIIGAIDNAVGPLSLLVAPLNMTRTIDSKLLKAITKDIENIYVEATLVEQKKRRLTFEVSVKDSQGELYAKATLTNFIIE